MVVEFAGMTMTLKDGVDLKEKFEKDFEEHYNDDGSACYVSKKEFEHKEEDGPNFSYNYAIQVLEMPDCNENGNVNSYVEILLVPAIKSLCDKLKKDLIDSNGVEEKYLSAYDLISYGCGVQMAIEFIELDEFEYDIMDVEKVAEKVYIAGNTIECINGVRGFYLDRAWNMVGTTGWDSIEEYINGKDAIKATLDRYK